MKKNYCLFMAILIMGVTNVFGQVSTWDGSISSSLTTEGNISLIQSAADLAFLAQDVNAGNSYAGKSLKLTTDIDLNSRNWTPIGYNGKTFNGIFDGNNHRISNLSITNSISNIGLFGSLAGGTAAQPTTIKKLSIYTANITIEDASSIIAGFGVIVGNTANHSNIENCDVQNATMKMGAKSQKFGIIVGVVWNSTIANCYVLNSKIENIASQATGGIAGNISGGQNKSSLTNCFVKDFTYTHSTASPGQGLISGVTAHTVTLNNCYATPDKDYPIAGQVISTTLIQENGVIVTPESMIKDASYFSNPELAWNFNTNGTTNNTAIWSHKGSYPIFADANNMAVYKAGTIYNNSMTGKQYYTSGVLPTNFTAIDLRTNSETIPNTDLVTLLNNGSKNLLVYSSSAIDNYTGNVITGNKSTINLTDGAPFYCPIKITNADITYTRNFSEGWNTICLPFPFATTTNDDNKVEKLVSGTTKSVSFEYVTDGTMANTPYLINIKTAGNKVFSATNATILTSSPLNDATADGYTFKGTMVASILTEGYGLILDETTQEVMFKKIPEAGFPITPFRAYLTSALTPSNTPLKVIHGDGGATGINKDAIEETFQIYAGDGCINIIASKAQTINMFSIDGRLTKSIQLNEGSNTINGVNKGVYLIDNQKVLVK